MWNCVVDLRQVVGRTNRTFAELLCFHQKAFPAFFKQRDRIVIVGAREQNAVTEELNEISTVDPVGDSLRSKRHASRARRRQEGSRHYSFLKSDARAEWFGVLLADCSIKNI